MADPRRLRSWAAAVVMAGMLTAPLAAQSWRGTAPYGGDVRSLAIDPADPDRVLAGTSIGQVYRSEDGGESWELATTDAHLAGWVVSDLLFDPNQPGRVWASLWGIFGGGTVVYSDDQGESWAPRGDGLPGQQVYALAAVEGVPGRLFAATRNGVYGSDNAGESWRYLTAAHPQIQKVTSLLTDPQQPDLVLAGTWRRAYRSHDAGRTWHGVFDGMILDSEVFSMQLVPGRSGRIWASTCGWVYRGERWGERWTRFTWGYDQRRTPSFQALPDGGLLAGTVAGVYRSLDDGASWQLRTRADLTVLAMAYDPRRPERVLIGTEGAGVWRSDDRGASFYQATSGLNNLRIAALVERRGELLVAVHDAGPSSGVYTSRDRGESFRHDQVVFPNILDLAVAEPKVYAATEGGLYERVGAEWRHIGEVGMGRVEQVVALDGTVMARTPDQVFRRNGERFELVELNGAATESLGLDGGGVWITGEYMLQRLEGAGGTGTPPVAGGRLTTSDHGLAWSGDQGVWLRPPGGSEWSQIRRKWARAIATGAERHPFLLVDEARRGDLYDAREGRLVSVDLPVPGRDVTAAVILDGAMYLGTRGYGLKVAELREPADSPVVTGAK